MKGRRKTHRNKRYEDGVLKEKEPIIEGVPFYVKLLGSCVVDLPNDEEHTASAVKKIVHEAKYGGGKLRKVSLTISPHGIVQADLETQDKLLDVPIHRISYCTADKIHEKVFGFIARDTRTEILEFTAYLCTKRKTAEALTLTVAQAFHIAFEIWDDARQDQTSLASCSSEGSRDESDSPTDIVESEPLGSPHRKSAPQAIPGTAPARNHVDADEFSFSSGVSPLSPPPSLDPPPRSTRVLTVKTDAPISCSAPPTVHAPPRPPRRLSNRPPPPPILVSGYGERQLLSNEDTAQLLQNLHIADDVGLDDCFSKLAESRSNPQLLDINVKRSPFDAEVIVHFSGHDEDRQRLLQSESSDSIFLKTLSPPPSCLKASPISELLST